MSVIFNSISFRCVLTDIPPWLWIMLAGFVVVSVFVVVVVAAVVIVYSKMKIFICFANTNEVVQFHLHSLAGEEEVYLRISACDTV